MNKKHIALSLVAILLLTLLCGCAPKQDAAAPAAVSQEPVTLIVAGGWPDCRALDEAAMAFTKLYPNCTVIYEYVQDYYASVGKRMAGDEPVDLFFTTNIQSDSDMLPYALELYGAGIELDDTFDGLIKNFVFRAEEGQPTQLYAVPLGAEMRGMYVNKTLLAQLGIDMPANQTALLSACQTLKAQGYIPMQGNPASFAQTLIYPWICSLIANAEDPDAMRAALNARQPGLSELFREPLSFLYSLVDDGYYDYKRAQTELDLFNDTTDEAYARYLLNIQQQGDAFVKADDLGRVAFMPAPISLESVVAKTKEDYHSAIDYAFTLSPVGSEGGYAYLSPAHGMAVCKNSANTEWAVRFLNYLLKPDSNKAFAETFHVIPNTKEAFSYLRTLFDVPDDRISELGQVTFTFDFYNIMQACMLDISKANNPKYMQDDGAGNLSIYPFEHFMEALELALQQQ